MLELSQNELQTAQKHTAIRKWADMLIDVNNKLMEKVNFDYGGQGGGHSLMDMHGGDSWGGQDDDDMDFMWLLKTFQ